MYRLCLPENDMSDRERVSAVHSHMLQELQAGHCVFVWFSLPCQPWCSWQRINAGPTKNDEQRDRIRKDRVHSRRMIALASSVVTDLLPRFPGKIHMAWEWPRYCDGWRLPELATLVKYLPIVVLMGVNMG